MLKLSELVGRLFNLAGLPGWIRRGNYRSTMIGVDVRVSISPLYTKVSVNGTDVFFHRLTGAIDGVGFEGGPKGNFPAPPPEVPGA